MLLFVQFVVMGGCSKDDNKAEEFADVHFSEQTYREVEFELAMAPAYGDSGTYPGPIVEWNQEDWETKIHYLPRQGFTHELPTQSMRDAGDHHNEAYYEMIGKYISQFGFGWDDTYGDNPETPYFDGQSPNSIHYMDLRAEANNGCDNILGIG